MALITATARITQASTQCPRKAFATPAKNKNVNQNVVEVLEKPLQPPFLRQVREAGSDRRS